MPTPRLTGAALLAAMLLSSAPASARGTTAAAPRLASEQAGEPIPGAILGASLRGLADRFSGAFRGAAYAARMADFFIRPARGLPLLRPLPELPVRPVRGTLSSPFGYRNDPLRKRRRRHHAGIDFDAERGTMVRAAGAGLVIKAERYYGYGRVVFLDHGLGVVTRYAHLRRIRVKEGEYVPAGAVIATVGSSGRSTGPHLHFEVRVDGIAVDPVKVVGAELDPNTPGWLDLMLDHFFADPEGNAHTRSGRRRDRPSG